MILESMTFTQNTGFSLIDLSYNTATTLKMKNCTFENNIGAQINLLLSTLIDENSVFSKNSNNASAGITLNSGSVYNGTGIKFYQQSAASGGAADIEKYSDFICDNCEFLENKSESRGGVIFAMNDGFYNITNSVFSYNSSGNRGAVIYASSSARESYIFNSTFAYNEAYEMGTIYLVESTLRLTSSQFKYNRSTTDSPGIILLGSILRCHDVDFMHQTGVSGSII